MPNWLSILITIVWNLGLLLVQFEVFASGSSAWKATMIGVQLLGNLPAIFGKQLVAGNKPPVPPAALLLLVGALGFGVAVGGCGDTMTTYYRSASTAAVATSTAYRTLATVDKDRQAGIRAVANEGKAAEAEKQLDAWLATYAKARKGLDAAYAVVEGAVAAGPVVELAVDKKTQAAAWIARLIALGAEVARILGDVGVKIGGGQ